MSHLQLPYHTSIFALVFVDEAPHVLIAKTKSNQSTWAEGDTLKGSTFLPRL